MSKSDTKRIVMIPEQKVYSNSGNFYSLHDIEDLAASIELNGLMNPLCVFRRGDGYVLFSGHRRLAAMRSLGSKYAEVPCIVFDDPQDADRETVMLIHANSTGRVLSAWETAEQAKRLKAALTNMKAKGADMPGRIRDMVADELGVSSAKLGRLDAITHNLTHKDWLWLFKGGSIGESVAYEISRLDETAQQNLYSWFTNVKGKQPREITLADIKEFRSFLDYADEAAKEDKPKPRKLNAREKQKAYEAEQTEEIASKLGPEWGQQLRMGKVSRAAAREIAELDEDEQSEFLEWCSYNNKLDKRNCWNIFPHDVHDWIWQSLREPAAAATAQRNEAKALRWKQCLVDEPQDGQTVAILASTDWLDVAVYRDGQYWYYADTTEAVEVKSNYFWCELPDMPKEWREKNEAD